jgi:hypothetical protein
MSLPYHIISHIGNIMSRIDQSTFAQLNKFFANEFSQNKIGLSIPRQNASMIRKCIENISKNNFINTLMIRNSYISSIDLLIGVEKTKIVFILCNHNISELPDVIGVYKLENEETYDNASAHMFKCIKKNKRNKLNKIISNITDLSLLPDI